MITAIAAIDEKQGLANDKKIPWPLLSTDWKRVLKSVEGKDLLMGYGTYAPMQHPLPSKNTYVLTESTEPLRFGYKAVADLEVFMKDASPDLILFGGALVFAETIKYADALDITQLEGDFDCTKFFPSFKDDFEMTDESDPITEQGITYRFQTWRRKKV